MKKITLIAAAVLSAATAFAQTSSAKVKSDTKARSEVTSNEHGKKVSTTATSSTTAEAEHRGTIVKDAAVKGKERKEKSKKEAGKKKAETEATGEATAETAVDAGIETKANAENHGKAVSEFAKTTTLQGRKKGQAIAELAGSKGMATTENTVEGAASTEADLATTIQTQKQDGKKAKGGKEKKEKAAKDSKETKQEDNHSKAVVEAAQSTEATVNAKGKAVKEVATAKRQNKPAKVEADASTKAAARVRAGRPTGAGRPVKVLSKGGKVTPVRAGGAVNVKTGVRVGKQ